MNNEHGKIRARLRGGNISVKVMIRHPMETGRRRHPVTEALIPRHYIRQVVCEHNGKSVMNLDWGWGISTNPYLAFEILGGASGDTVAVRWTDDLQNMRSLETTIA
jgi:sulfur-oxidizing protein SoxZ